MEVGVDGHVVSEPLGRSEQRFELYLLDGPIAALAASDRVNGLENFVVVVWSERLRDLGLPLDEGESRRILHDLKVVPEIADDAVDCGPAIRQGERAHDLRKVRVGSGANEQPARVAAVFVRVYPEPGPGPAASAERILIEFRRFVESPRAAALAAYDQIGQVAGGADLVEPELAPATFPRSVDESGPVEVIHMSARAGTHEAGGHHGKAVEAPLLVERLAVHEPSGTIRSLAGAAFLHDEPLWKAPCPDSPRGRPRLSRLRRWRIELRRGDSGHCPELARQPRLQDFIEAARIWPGVEPPDNRGVSGQVDERTRPIGGDHLTLAEFAVALAAHAPSSTCRPVSSRRNKSTTGSTSRSDRLARNLRWCSDSKSLSSISRSSGEGDLSS